MEKAMLYRVLCNNMNNEFIWINYAHVENIILESLKLTKEQILFK